MRALRIASVLVLVPLGACGVIFNGSNQAIQVQSSPDAAKVTANPGGQTSTTPTTLTLSRKDSYTLTFTKDGYKDATFSIQSHAKGGIIVLDVLLTGLVGVVIDAATGGWNGLSPESATVAMTKSSAMVSGPDTIYVRVARNKDGVKVESTLPVGMQVQTQPVH
ncbi:MAG TPA: hypothetical protein VEV39_03205 [Gemmatimonadales bacterium]|nr:hypothetical protein [Gemmatimonadales bacterium]